MEAYVKSFASYRIVKKCTVLSYALVMDSLDAELSTVTVKGTEVTRSNTGDWLIVGGGVYMIQNVKPQDDRAVLTLQAPLEAFSRLLEYMASGEDAAIGSFVARMMEANWRQCDDPAYGMPYLRVSTSDTPAFVLPDLDDAGCFSLPDYCRLARKSYHVAVRFSDGGQYLECSISMQPMTTRRISFSDGRSQLKGVTYSRSGIAKLTVLHDVETGETDASGNPVYNRSRSVWYLAETGEITQELPAVRAAGEWGMISVAGEADIQAKVIETFARNKFTHKLEFWSTIDLAVLEDCEFWVHGELLRSHISYKSKSSTDHRYYYKSGELATTATEKLRRS